MLFLLVSHGVIQFTLFEIFQLKYKADATQKIMNGVTEADLQLIKIKKADIQNHLVKFYWENNKEFRFQNHIYDLVKSETTEDYLLLYCIEDNNESKLYSILDKWLGSIFEETDGTPDELSGFTIYLSHYYSSSDYLANRYYSQINSLNYKFSFKLLEGMVQVITPPPQA